MKSSQGRFCQRIQGVAAGFLAIGATVAYFCWDKQMGRLSQYIWLNGRRSRVGGLCAVGTASLVMLIPWWIRDVVRIIEQGGAMRDVTYYAVLIIAAALAQGLVRTFSRALIFNAGRDVEYDLRNDLFAHLQKLPTSFYQSQRTGDLMSRVINDISAVCVMLRPGGLQLG